MTTFCVFESRRVRLSNDQDDATELFANKSTSWRKCGIFERHIQVWQMILLDYKQQQHQYIRSDFAGS